MVNNVSFDKIKQIRLPSSYIYLFRTIYNWYYIFLQDSSSTWSVIKILTFFLFKREIIFFLSNRTPIQVVFK